MIRAFACENIFNRSLIAGVMFCVNLTYAQDKAGVHSREANLEIEKTLQDTLGNASLVKVVQQPMIIGQQNSELAYLHQRDSLWSTYIENKEDSYNLFCYYKDSLPFSGIVLLDSNEQKHFNTYALYKEGNPKQYADFDPTYGLIEFLKTKNTLSLAQKISELPGYISAIFSTDSLTTQSKYALAGYTLIEQTPGLNVYQPLNNPFTVLLEYTTGPYPLYFSVSQRKNIIEVVAIDGLGDQMRLDYASITSVGLTQKRTYTQYNGQRGIWDMYVEQTPTYLWKQPHQYYRDFERLRDKGKLRARVVVYNELGKDDQVFFKLLMALNFNLELFRKNIFVSDMSYAQLLEQANLDLLPNKQALYRIIE